MWDLFCFDFLQVDEFTLEAVDLGQVFKIRVRHDNSFLSPDWYLEEVEVIDLDTEEDFLFLCERWLSRKREDMRICRVFYVKVCVCVCTVYGCLRVFKVSVNVSDMY